MTVGIFRRGRGISQQKPIFAAKGHFHSPFRSPFCSWEMRGWGCEMTLVSQMGVLQRFSQLRNGALAIKLSFWGPWMVSQRVSQLQNGGLGYEMALVWQRKVSQLWNFLQRGAMGLRNYFAKKGPFHNKPLISQRVPFGCEIILQRMTVFTGGLFWAAKFCRPLKFLASELLLAHWDLSSPLLQFLLNLIIQKV